MNNYAIQSSYDHYYLVIKQIDNIAVDCYTPNICNASIFTYDEACKHRNRLNKQETQNGFPPTMEIKKIDLAPENTESFFTVPFGKLECLLKKEGLIKQNESIKKVDLLDDGLSFLVKSS